MITLHHLENSQSIRILWLLEELKMEYDFKMYDRDPKTMLAPKAYKAISPLGTAPCITDGKVTLSESNAIIEYILDKAEAESWRPGATSKNRAKYLFWFHASQGSLQSILTMSLVLSITTARTPRLLRPLIKKVLGLTQSGFVQPRLKALLAVLETDLSESKFVAGGRITAADIALGYTLEMAGLRGVLDEYPNCQRYVDRMITRPAFKRAVEKDGKYTGLPG